MRLRRFECAMKIRINIVFRVFSRLFVSFRVSFRVFSRLFASFRVSSPFGRTVIKRSRNNRKVFYSYDSNINRKNGSKKIGPLVNSNGVTAYDDKEIVKLLNDYFASVFTINNSSMIDQSISDLNISNDSLQMLVITESMVVKTIGSFKEHKSPGTDGITSTYAIKTKDILVKPLCLLFNRSLDRNEIPDDWKRANITPIFKKGDKSNVENYRPISLTSFYGKVFEKIIKQDVEEEFVNGNFIKKTQHGFSKGRSCLSNLLICQESIIDSIDNGSSIDIIYLDFQKAFDKVPHCRLIEKMKEAGIGDSVLRWICNWLKGRIQRVGLNGTFSDWTNVTSGVPQGSILGPLLFSIYINDLEDNVRNRLLKCADDSKIWGRVDTVEEINCLQEDLDVLGKWAITNQMPFNVTKCKVMNIGKKNRKAEYKLMGSVLSKTKEEKDLGVFFFE